LVVEGIGHDADDGAGWNVVHRGNDLVHKNGLLTARSGRIIEGSTSRRRVRRLRRRHDNNTQSQDRERDNGSEELPHEELNPRIQ
jgi:hypothetical protein